MTHRIEVNAVTGEVTQIPYTPAEAAAYTLAKAAQAAQQTKMEKLAAIETAKAAALEKMLLQDPEYAALVATGPATKITE